MSKLLSTIKNKPYYSKDDFVLYNAECIEILNQLPENSIDMIFADPPYNLSNGGFSLHAGKRVSVHKGDWDKSRGFQGDYDFHKEWLTACHRVLKDNGTIWVSGTYHSIYQCGTAMQEIGFHILNDIAWFKPNASPNLSCRFFTASHETLIWARKSKKGKHHFDYQSMKNGDWKEDFIKKPGLQMRSVWSIYPPKREEKIHGKHPTQKPLELLRRCILASTKKGDIIIDPFNGGGTTGIASKIIKDRKYIGIDLEKKYLDLSVKRYESIDNKKALYSSETSIIIPLEVTEEDFVANDSNIKSVKPKKITKDNTKKKVNNNDLELKNKTNSTNSVTQKKKIVKKNTAPAKVKK